MATLWTRASPKFASASASAVPLMSQRTAARITSIHAIPLTYTAAPAINHSIAKSNERKTLLARPGLLGIKREMISWFTPSGEQYAATIIEIDSCEVIDTISAAKNGYSAVKVGHVDKLKNVDRGVLRACEAAGVSPKAKISEFRVRTDDGLILPGAELRADYFAVGQLVDVKGTTKGKGFAGVMKRHGFKGLGATHGVSVSHRSAGSMGATQDPGRVLPGKKMAGRMGGNNCTVHNNEVLHADGDAGILVVKGQIPGPRGAYVKVSDARKVYGKSLIAERKL
ncbi:hypothetical protein HF325_002698 [Metschnikowia pulcherrima]|uniref:Large ribosomal subunit protein uL3m n=1 Tax=Metschnikowia pulcherrima TaxID=27326 RepID=A0A8H7GU45_9ASCO|nr:hypothetical protein HF325_002698 [Metschnikowia pulcherrima]